MWIHNFQTVITRINIVGLYIVRTFVPDVENRKREILIIISYHHLKLDELNIVFCRLLYLRLISVCKIYVITVWIIVFAITVFLIEKPSWLGWPFTLTGFGSFVNSHNESVRVLVTTKSVNNHHHHMVLIYLREDSWTNYFIVWKIVCQKIQMFWSDMTTDIFMIFVWMLEIKEFIEIILPNNWRMDEYDSHKCFYHQLVIWPSLSSWKEDILENRLTSMFLTKQVNLCL